MHENVSNMKHRHYGSIFVKIFSPTTLVKR
uniref:Uncharacterized protein n=1 Tax=Arundo donax TaxID=35708 RepID=A0A0A9BUR8_ARUDO